MKKDVHRRGNAQMAAEDLKSSDEGPAIRVQLGGGRVDLREEFPLEGCKWKAHTHAFEYCLVHEEKGGPIPRPIIHTYGFPRCAVANGDVGIVGAIEGVEVV